MGVRRDRPSEQRSGLPGLRLRDGRTLVLSVREPGEPDADVCCFCGEAVARSDPRHVTLSARWSSEPERVETWAAHDSCLAERLDEGAAGPGHV
jgi:hypothetical protein